MSDDDYFAVARRQRACREFADREVSDEVIGRILTNATWAPSAENAQPWEFVVVRDRARRTELASLARRAWHDGARDWERTRLDPELFDDVDRGMTGGFATAPVWIVVCADTERALPATVGESIWPAVQNILLAATALGLGSALTTIVTVFANELTELLDLPDHVVPVAAVPVGHPARPMGRSRREPFDDHTHRDRYGQPWAGPT